MADWLGRDDSMIAYINDLLSGQRTRQVTANVGPAFGNYSETTPRVPPLDWTSDYQPIPEYRPTRQGGIGIVGNIGPARGVLSATGESRPDGSLALYPNVGLQAGPLNVRAGLEHLNQPGYSHTRPNFGFGAGFPVGQGSVQGDVSVVPGQSQTVGGQFNYPLSPDTVISALLGHTRFDSGQPSDTRAGIALRHRFPAPRRYNDE